jgi:hypothetical protein
VQAGEQKNDRNDQKAVNLAFAEFRICWQTYTLSLKTFSLLRSVVDGGYVQPFFDGTSAPSLVSPLPQERKC